MKIVGGILALAVVVVVVGGLAWALYATGALNFRAGSTAIVLIIVGGVLSTGGLAGVFMWLAFYSSRHGYDDSPRFDSAGRGEGLD
ncbi:MAG TPA: hypothetical protein VII63_07225 [Caulobacteraceae bacterium]